jgi:bifunctional UDP-N-acetylglucosamine pyrophosphorylase/glucosamine-1-phosphate N-acetyltransferase
MKNNGFEVVLGHGVIVNSFNNISNNVTIDRGTLIMPFNIISNSKIGKDCIITSSKIIDSEIKNYVKIGPNANLRPNSKIENRVKIGNFVEVKNSHIKRGSKVAHMSYIGDGEIGTNCNIGCGTIFCNYDGKNKHKTILKNNVFVGSNSNLVAPIKLGHNCVVGAGSTLTDDVEPYSLAIARQRQKNIKKYVKKRKKGLKTAKNA